jgi:glutaredoxin
MPAIFVMNKSNHSKNILSKMGRKRMQDKIILYTREKCPLCDEAKEEMAKLRHLGYEIEEIDIYQDDELIERFGLMIPVVEYNGEILQYGQVDAYTVKRLLQNCHTF